MCRWATWIGAPRYIEDVLSCPGHSLIEQASHAEEAKTTINADGVGVAWYGDRAEPGLYRDVLPAWSDPNLRSLSRTVQSPLFMCHVRASTGTATSRNNCHPFAVDEWSFMHDGQIGGFDAFRRRADMLIPDAIFGQRKGATDSECLFLLALSEGLEEDPKGALERATGRLWALSAQYGMTPHLRLSIGLSDGERFFAVRHATDEFVPTIYQRWDAEGAGRLVASEPLDEEQWTELPANSITTFVGRDMETEPFEPVIGAHALAEAHAL